MTCDALQGGHFYRKVDKQGGQTPAGFKGWVNLERTHLLSVEDPKVSRQQKDERVPFCNNVVY